MSHSVFIDFVQFLEQSKILGYSIIFTQNNYKINLLF